MNQQGNRQYEQAMDVALIWVARLRSDAVSDEDRQAFALWLGEDSCHPQAMDEALALWDDLAVVRHMPTTAQQTAKAANSGRWFTSAAALAACLVLALFLWPQLVTDPVSTQYQTALGERQEITLPDGSRAVLNTDSSLSVTYTEAQRHIALERGEAWFQVHPNKSRPFHVDAGEARITALGTAFNIHRRDNGTDITVTEGVVRVTELGETGARVAAVEILRENQQLLTSRQGWEISAASDLEQQLAWQKGQLVAREMPLQELLAELQRYHDSRILLSDPDIATRTVSGVFDLDNPEATLRALAISLDLETQVLDKSTVRLLKADQ